METVFLRYDGKGRHDLSLHSVPTGAFVRRVSCLWQKSGEDGLLGRGLLRGAALSRKKDNVVTVTVHGVGYSEFANLKWHQFLRGFSAAVLLLVVVVMILAFTKQMPRELPWTVILVLILVILAVFAIYRSTIRREYKRSGLGNMELCYIFDRDGWTVKNAKGKATVLWSKTWRVRRNDRALLLYPNRKSVNLVPLRAMTESQVQQIISFCTGRKKKT